MTPLLLFYLLLAVMTLVILVMLIPNILENKFGPEFKDFLEEKAAKKSVKSSK